MGKDARKTATKMIELAAIKSQNWAQARESIDQSIVDEYAEQMKAGAKFPPVIVFHNGKEFFGGDGMHRAHAAAKIGTKRILAEVHHGGMREAMLHAVAANASHGLRRSNADKRRAVMILLNDAEWSKWSDRAIAGKCAVGKTMVNEIRNELSVRKGQMRRTVTRGGKTFTMDTSKINESKSSPEKSSDRKLIDADASFKMPLPKGLRQDRRETRPDAGIGASEPKKLREIEEKIAKAIGVGLYRGYSRGVVTIGLTAAEKLLSQPKGAK